MTGRDYSIFLLLGATVLICTVGYYWSHRDKAEQAAGATEVDCATIEHQWSLRTGEDALHAMHHSATSAINEGNVGIASCTLRLAISRAWNSHNDTLAYKSSLALADLYLQDGRFEKARSTLKSVLAHLDKDPETNRIRRVETYLTLISVSKSAGDENGVHQYIAQARDEAKDLTMGILVKDRLFLAAIEHYEGEGNYLLAAQRAKDLLESRREWNERMPDQIDSEYVEAAREEYGRLKELSER